MGIVFNVTQEGDGGFVAECLSHDITGWQCQTIAPCVSRQMQHCGGLRFLPSIGRGFLGGELEEPEFELAGLVG